MLVAILALFFLLVKFWWWHQIVELNIDRWIDRWRGIGAPAAGSDICVPALYGSSSKSQCTASVGGGRPSYRWQHNASKTQLQGPACFVLLMRHEKTDGGTRSGGHRVSPPSVRGLSSWKAFTWGVSKSKTQKKNGFRPTKQHQLIFIIIAPVHPGSRQCYGRAVCGSSVQNYTAVVGRPHPYRQNQQLQVLLSENCECHRYVCHPFNVQHDELNVDHS